VLGVRRGESGLVGEYDRLDAVADVELLEQVCVTCVLTVVSLL
jgi:hypothetical protein